MTADLTKMLARYRGRRVLVTGDTGFKGSWLSFWLHRLGAEVFGFANAYDAAALWQALDLDHAVAHNHGDVRDSAAVHALFEATRPDHVFHLAAQSLVRPSYDDPAGTFATNVQGTVHVLDAARRHPSIKSVVVVTSDKCYRNREWTWGYRETDELGGHDPYSASKAAAEVVSAAFAESFFKGATGLATVRAGNVIGGGDEADSRIVPDCIRALRKKAALVLRRPHARRPWQHVLEPLGGYLMLALVLGDEPHHWGGGWNFGPRSDAVQTVLEVAERVIAGWHEPVPIEVEPANFHETNALRLNIDKVTELLGWSPRWGFERTVAETVSWYRAAASGADMKAFTAQQIDTYLASHPSESQP